MHINIDGEYACMYMYTCTLEFVCSYIHVIQNRGQCCSSNCGARKLTTNKHTMVCMHQTFEVPNVRGVIDYQKTMKIKPAKRFKCINYNRKL